MLDNRHLSITTGSLNRLAPLRRALATWLSYPEPDEILIVDWGNKVPLRESLRDFKDPRIVIVRATDQAYWHNSKCHNLELQMATGDLILRLDNDCLMGRDFFHHHHLRGGDFFAGYWQDVPFLISDRRNLCGTILARKADFLSVNGYNERLDMYGTEDDDLYDRLTTRGLVRRNIDLSTLDHITHSDTERMKNLKVPVAAVLPQGNRTWPEQALDNLRNMSLRVVTERPWSLTDRMTEWTRTTVLSNYIECSEAKTSWQLLRESSVSNMIPKGQPVRVWFVNFYHLFNPHDNLITRLLMSNFQVMVTPDNPEYLFYSVFGSDNIVRDPKYTTCTKIFVTEENVQRPDLSPRRLGNYDDCDFSLTTAFSDDLRHCRLPMVYVQFLVWWKHYWGDFWKDHEGPGLIKPPTYNPVAILQSKTKFCNFVYSNPGAPERNAFFELLSKYKKVDSGGAVFNNLGYKVGAKVRFLEDYKFTVAFENSSAPGYVTEKLFEPMGANSLPIYWGNPRVAEDFNVKSFIDVTGMSMQAAVEKVIEVDRNDALYLKYLSEPWFEGNRPNQYCQPDYLGPWFQRVVDARKRKLGQPVSAPQQGAPPTCGTVGTPQMGAPPTCEPASPNAPVRKPAIPAGGWMDWRKS